MNKKTLGVGETGREKDPQNGVNQGNDGKKNK
jgi:hypothetical protein